MPTDSATWRSIRQDFESLPPAGWSLIWSSRPPVSLSGVQLLSQWTWFHPTNAALRARASAIFLKAAKSRGYDSEDKWLDELRNADFVRFQISGHGTEKLPDGTFADSESGVLKDAITHSITLCHQLEAGSAPKAIIGRLPSEPIARMEAGGPVSRVKSNGQGRKRGPKPDYEGAARVAEIVARVAPDGGWRGRLDDVCEALDEAAIPFPAKWRRDRQCRCWADCLEKPIAIKAIEYRLEIAKQRSKTTPETLS
jgi:hypothetical protein